MALTQDGSLVEKLIEYKKFKNIAQEIESLIAKANDYLPRDFTHSQIPIQIQNSSQLIELNYGMYLIAF